MSKKLRFISARCKVCGHSLDSAQAIGTPPNPPPRQAGSPTASALETVIASDERIAFLQREIELLEADAEGATPGPREAGDASNSSAPPQPPAPPASGAGAPLLAMSELHREIDELSLEEKAARLAEAYEDLDVLVRAEGRCVKRDAFGFWALKPQLAEHCGVLRGVRHRDGWRCEASVSRWRPRQPLAVLIAAGSLSRFLRRWQPPSPPQRH